VVSEQCNFITLFSLVNHLNVLFNLTGVLNVTVLIDCKRSFVAKVVVGRGGQSISSIAKICGQELRNLFRCEVRLTFMVQPERRAE